MSSAKWNNCDEDSNNNVAGLIRAGSAPCCLGSVSGCYNRDNGGLTTHVCSSITHTHFTAKGLLSECCFRTKMWPKNRGAKFSASNSVKDPPPPPAEATAAFAGLETQPCFCEAPTNGCINDFPLLTAGARRDVYAHLCVRSQKIEHFQTFFSDSGELLFPSPKLSARCL